MSESRRDILEMLAKGQITTDEAERLLGLLENKAPSAGPRDSPGSRAKAKPEYLRVVVESDEGYDSGATVNVRVPMQLLRAGVRLAGLLPVQARGPVNDALRSHGVPIDLSQIRPENLEELVDQLSDLTVDVAQNRQKVRVFCE